MSYPPSPQQPESRGPAQYPAGQYPAAQYPAGHYSPGRYAPRPYFPGPDEPGPGQRGQVPPGPYAPAGYPRARPGRPGLLVPAVLLGVLAAAAVGIALVLGRAAAECSSNIGQIAQAFDQQAAGDCSAASTARAILEIAAPVLALGCIAMIIGYRRQ